MAQFEERVFALLRDFINVGQRTPDVLTTIMQVIQIQEQVDKNSQGAVRLCTQERYRSGRPLPSAPCR